MIWSILDSKARRFTKSGKIFPVFLVCFRAAHSEGESVADLQKDQKKAAITVCPVIAARIMSLQSHHFACAIMRRDAVAPCVRTWTHATPAIFGIMVRCMPAVIG